ncbi:MAG: heme-binding protein, partial [Candidatus Hydrogenedentes bacterium]|nr:heme-binding protein [Candidatus Hydrogenedentota bacterium]
YKGIAVRLDEGLGGISSGREFMVFDTDTLRWAGGWSGYGFNDWRSIALNGQHEIHPSIVGDLLFTNPVAPGWGRPSDGSFADERVLGRDGLRYGPLAREWGHWNGHYIHGDKVVLSYSVGGTEILEMPSAEGPSSSRMMTRTLNLGPRSQPLTLQVAREEGTMIALEDVGGLRTARFVIPERGSAAASQGRVAFRGRTSLEIDDFNESVQGDFSIYARIKTKKGGTIFSYAAQSGSWAKNSWALFVRDNHLVFDRGWVGEVESRREVGADGDWHDVLMTYDADLGDARLYIDGRLNGKSRLKPTGHVEDHIARIGLAADDFPVPQRFFQGAISEVRFYSKRIEPDDVPDLPDSSRKTRLAGRWIMAEQRGKVIPNSVGGSHDARIVGSAGAPLAELVAAVREGGAGSRFVSVEGEGGVSDLRLTVPAGDDPLRLSLCLGRVPRKKALDSFAEVVRSSENAVDLTSFTKGGPAHWTEKLVTQGKRGNDDGAYAIDIIEHPADNPYRSWLRFGGFNFFEDDSRVAICTWSGDVWIVEGINESLDKLTWQRIASGMFQPLGIAIVDGDIYVLCRDQITVLRDLNGDGETDFYENFNNDHQVTEHFHEFALDLKYAIDGNFYYTKGGRHGADSITPNHGTLIRVSRDGTKSEFVANGFRAPNGLGLGPAGEFLIADNEGHWTPANRINWVKPGGFYGYMWGYHEGQTINGFDEPLCWIHPSIDRSP